MKCENCKLNFNVGDSYVVDENGETLRCCHIVRGDVYIHTKNGN